MIATRFHPGNHSNILGYNIINEPWAGNVYKVNFTKILLNTQSSAKKNLA
jgi:hypothetical protein